MATAYRPEDLIAWQLAWELKQRVYAFTETRPVSQDFKFCDDMRRAARSAPFNTSEGFYRFAPLEFRRFLRTARGSLGEIRDQLRHARDARYLAPEEFDTLFRLANRAIQANTKLQNYLLSCRKDFTPPPSSRKPDDREPEQ